MRRFWIALAFLLAIGTAFFAGRLYNADVGTPESPYSTPCVEDPRPWLGVSVRDLDPLDAANLEVALDTGVLVTRVNPLGPAHSKLRKGDFITKLQRFPPSNAVAWLDALGQLKIGETIDCQFQRGDAILSVKLKVAGRIPGAVSIISGTEPQFEAASDLGEMFEIQDAEMEDLKLQTEELRKLLEESPID